jgi:hypothetical protein
MQTETAVATVPEAACSCCGTPYPDAELVHLGHDEWAGLDLAPGRLHPPQATDYGLLEFALVDPHGNLVRKGGSLDGTP